MPCIWVWASRWNQVPHTTQWMYNRKNNILWTGNRGRHNKETKTTHLRHIDEALPLLSSSSNLGATRLLCLFPVATGNPHRNPWKATAYPGVPWGPAVHSAEPIATGTPGVPQGVFFSRGVTLVPTRTRGIPWHPVKYRGIERIKQCVPWEFPRQHVPRGVALVPREFSVLFAVVLNVHRQETPR